MKIKIGERFRKDLGDLDVLKQSIKDIGLLHPVVVDEGGNLIAGGRRCEAWKQLDRNLNDIPVNVVNIPDALRGEHDENAVRKNFTPSEAVAIWEAMEKRHGNRFVESSDSDGSTERRKRASKVLNLSTDSLSKAKQIMESKNKELITEMDKQKQGNNINSAYRKLQRMKDEEQIKNNHQNPIKGKFKTIVIDPPWNYDENIIGRTKPTYALLSMETLETLDIMKYADETCHLYLWTTNAYIWRAIELGKRWGFLYKTCLTWCKPTIGLGTYFRNNTEHCLFFIKEGSKSTRAKNIGTWFEAERGEHSQKPEIFYEIVERASFPPYLDIFGRRQRKNWAVFGNLKEALK